MKKKNNKLNHQKLKYYLDELQVKKSPFREWWVKNNKNTLLKKNNLISDLRKKEMLKFREEFSTTMKTSNKLLASIKKNYKKYGDNKYYSIFLNNVSIYYTYENFQFGGVQNPDCQECMDDSYILSELLKMQFIKKSKITNDEINLICLHAASIKLGRGEIKYSNEGVPLYPLTPEEIYRILTTQARDVFLWQNNKQLKFGSPEEKPVVRTRSRVPVQNSIGMNTTIDITQEEFEKQWRQKTDVLKQILDKLDKKEIKQSHNNKFNKTGEELWNQVVSSGLSPEVKIEYIEELTKYSKEYDLKIQGLAEERQQQQTRRQQQQKQQQARRQQQQARRQQQQTRRQQQQTRRQQQQEQQQAQKRQQQWQQQWQQQQQQARRRQQQQEQNTNEMKLNKIIQECMKIFDFSSIKELNSNKLKKKFKEISLKNHPDKGGNTEKFQEYQQCRDYLQAVLDGETIIL